MNQEKKPQPPIYHQKVRYRLVWNHARHLRERDIQPNTRIGRLRQLRAVMNEAYRRDLVAVEPFKRIKLENMVAKKGHLTLTQLHQLERMTLTGREERARDLFLIGCYTGLRFSDIVTLRQEHIGQDNWLRKKTIKTGVTVEIPTDRLFRGGFLLLVGKYGGDIGRLTSQKMQNSDVNRLLKPLLRRVKADPKVTFHSSRHTFATLLSRQGVGDETTQQLLGHQSLQTTRIYNEAAGTATRQDIERGLKRLFRDG